MGSFYVNFTTYSPSDAVVDFLRATNRKSYVSPTVDGVTVFFDEEADSQDDAVIIDLGKRSSEALSAPVFAALNHDDDFLAYWLFDRGNLIDQYNSCPGYFDGGSETPEGGDPVILCAAFAVPQGAEQLDAILKNVDFVFAMERHEELAKLLKHPWRFASLGYQNIEEGDLSEGLSQDDLVCVK